MFFSPLKISGQLLVAAFINSPLITRIAKSRISIPTQRFPIQPKGSVLLRRAPHPRRQIFLERLALFTFVGWPFVTISLRFIDRSSFNDRNNRIVCFFNGRSVLRDLSFKFILNRWLPAILDSLRFFHREVFS